MKKIHSLEEFLLTFPLDYIQNNTTARVTTSSQWVKTVQDWCKTHGYFVPKKIIVNIINDFTT